MLRRALWTCLLVSFFVGHTIGCSDDDVPSPDKYSILDDAGVDVDTGPPDTGTDATPPDTTLPPDTTIVPDQFIPPDMPLPTCTDGIFNGLETDKDCGGPVCAPCDDGKKCATTKDCKSAVCTSSGTCASPTCVDGVLNGDETDMRFRDAPEHVVGLCAKGKARADESGFVVPTRRIPGPSVDLEYYNRQS